MKFMKLFAAGLIVTGALVIIWSVQPGKSQRATTGDDIARVTVVDPEEAKADGLRQALWHVHDRFEAIRNNEFAGKDEVFADYAALCDAVDQIDWQSFQDKDKLLWQLEHKLAPGSREYQQIWSTIARRSYIAPLQHDARILYARALRDCGDAEGCRLQLRKLMKSCAWFVPTWEFMIVANRVHDPADQEFARDFEAAIAKAAEARQEDARLLSFWMNQVLKQPQTGEFHFYRSDVQLALIDDQDPDSVPLNLETEGEHSAKIVGKGRLTIGGNATVEADGKKPASIGDEKEQEFQVESSAKITLSAKTSIAFKAESDGAEISMDGSKTVKLKKGSLAKTYGATILYLGEPKFFFGREVKIDLSQLEGGDSFATTGDYSARGWELVHIDCNAVAHLADCRLVQARGKSNIKAERCTRVIASSKSVALVKDCAQTWAWDNASVIREGGGIIHPSKYATVK